MMPVGTGIFKVYYDADKHNKEIKQAVDGKHKERANIVEEKLKLCQSVMNKVDVSKLLNFNLVDSIH